MSEATDPTPKISPEAVEAAAKAAHKRSWSAPGGPPRAPWSERAWTEIADEETREHFRGLVQLPLEAAIEIERPAIHSSVLEGLKAKLSEDLAADDFEQATVESLEEWFDAWAASLASEGGERT